MQPAVYRTTDTRIFSGYRINNLLIYLDPVVLGYWPQIRKDPFTGSLSYSTHSLQIVPDTWFTHNGIWGEPRCPGKSVNRWMRDYVS